MRDNTSQSSLWRWPVNTTQEEELTLPFILRYICYHNVKEGQRGEREEKGGMREEREKRNYLTTQAICHLGGEKKPTALKTIHQ